MKNLLIITLFFITLSSFAFQRVDIYPDGSYQTHELTGVEGANGKDGKDAYAIDCSDGLRRNGRQGENGADGEAGTKGRDAYVFYHDVSELKKITLLQKGGKGGKPGKGGFGTAGCFGGEHGHKGQMGTPGEDGEYGDIYLIDPQSMYQKSDSTQVISLADFAKEGIVLSHPKWSIHNGSRHLFNKKSDIKPYYRKYEGNEEYNVTLLWSATQSLNKVGSTKIAFSIRDGRLTATTYSGPIIDFRMWREGQTYYFEVLDANSVDEFKNLDFGKIRGSGEDMLLEVQEQFHPRVALTTEFVISLYENKGNGDKFIGQFKLDKDFILKQGHTYYLMLGNLNFPAEYKKPGIKLKIHLSVYRSAREQTRVFGLKGLFKI